MIVVGIDLAGVQKRPTGYCKLEDMNVETSVVYTDEEILHRIDENRPALIAIDAPLSLPPGRKSLEERTSSHLRDCDRELIKRGIRFFPLTLGPMRELTRRGMNLKQVLKQQGFDVMEAYPGGAQDVLGIGRKQRGLDNLRIGLENLGLKGLRCEMTDHELDAATIAYVGKLYLEGNAVVYGDACEGIVMPKGEKKTNLKGPI